VEEYSEETVDQNIVNTIRQFALSQRRQIYDMAHAAGADSAHIGGALSLVEVTATLFSSVMKIDRSDPHWTQRDRFILSKGHGVLSYYTALAEVGFITREELMTFEKDGSFLLGHPVINRDKGIEFSTGSLGMGLSLGLGLALTAKRRKMDNKIFVALGDGECNEGSVWEAAMAAPQHKLDNITCIVDRNGFQQTGSNEDIMSLGDVGAKFRSFGWQVLEVDGHDVEQLYRAFTSHHIRAVPRAVIAKTIKGKGFSEAEGDNAWHHKILTGKLYDQAVNELEPE